MLERSNPLWALRGSDECASDATRAVQVLSEEAEWLLECIWAASLLQTAYQHADTTHTLNGGSQMTCLVGIFQFRYYLHESYLWCCYDMHIPRLIRAATRYITVLTLIL